MKEERNHLIKVHVTHSGDSWILKPKSNTKGNLEYKNDIIFKGDDEQFRKFLIKLGAKDTETSPASVRNYSYVQMVNDIKTGKDREIWVWSKFWNNNKSNKVVMSMRQKENKIEVTEDFRIPGTNVIVEKRQQIGIVPKERISENKEFKVGNDTWYQVEYDGYTGYVAEIDSTHFKFILDPSDEGVEKKVRSNSSTVYHVGQFRSSPGYDSLVDWLHGRGTIAGTILESTDRVRENRDPLGVRSGKRYETGVNELRPSKKLKENKTISKGDSFIVTVSTRTDEYDIHVDSWEGEITDIVASSIDSDIPYDWKDAIKRDKKLLEHVKMWNNIALYIKQGIMTIFI